MKSGQVSVLLSTLIIEGIWNVLGHLNVIGKLFLSCIKWAFTFRRMIHPISHHQLYSSLSITDHFHLKHYIHLHNFLQDLVYFHLLQKLATYSWWIFHSRPINRSLLKAKYYQVHSILFRVPLFVYWVNFSDHSVYERHLWKSECQCVLVCPTKELFSEHSLQCIIVQ